MAAKVVLVGLDVGSTTLKLVVLNAETRAVIFEHYQRHRGEIIPAAQHAIDQAVQTNVLPSDAFAKFCVAGSAGIFLSKMLQLPFVQEVVACSTAVLRLLPGPVDAALELGGEDAKLIRFRGNAAIDARMNTTCAAGTGAFLDTLSALLGVDGPAGLDELASRSTTKLSIASRCGVFAKTDVQQLLAEGARKEDVAAAVFTAIVDQAESGLACGSPIAGRVALLGGPLHFLPTLRKTFAEALHCDVVAAPNAHEMVALGAAIHAAEHSGMAPMPVPFLLRRFRNLAL